MGRASTAAEKAEKAAAKAAAKAAEAMKAAPPADPPVPPVVDPPAPPETDPGESSAPDQGGLLPGQSPEPPPPAPDEPAAAPRVSGLVAALADLLKEYVPNPEEAAEDALIHLGDHARHSLHFHGDVVRGLMAVADEVWCYRRDSAGPAAE